jgi:hypothetical protein
METTMKTEVRFTLLDLLKALQDAAANDAEAIAVLEAMICAGHVRLASETAYAA